jgi:DNA transformation protein
MRGLRKLSELEKMPNIGKVAASLLTEAGIDTPDKLVKAGSKEAFLRIREIDPTACIRMLYGLEGAVKGLPDKLLPKESKEDLLSFFRAL